MTAWLSKNIFSLVTILICVGTVVVNRLGFIEDAMLQSVTLMTLAFFIIADVIEKRKIDSDLRKIFKLLESINDVSAYPIPDSRSLYKYLADRIQYAKYWDILTSSDYEKRIETWREKKDYHKATLKAVNNHLQLRRSLTICDKAHLNHLIERMNIFEGKNYSVVGLPKIEQPFPPFNMIIINKEEVVLWPSERGAGAGSIRITDPLVAEKFNQYYSHIWTKNEDYLLKNEVSIFEKRLCSLRDRLKN